MKNFHFRLLFACSSNLGTLPIIPKEPFTIIRQRGRGEINTISSMCYTAQHLTSNGVIICTCST